MSPETMQNWLIAVGLIVGSVLGTFCIRFLAQMNDKHLQRLADVEAHRNIDADEIGPGAQS